MIRLGLLLLLLLPLIFGGCARHKEGESGEFEYYAKISEASSYYVVKGNP